MYFECTVFMETFSTEKRKVAALLYVVSTGGSSIYSHVIGHEDRMNEASTEWSFHTASGAEAMYREVYEVYSYNTWMSVFDAKGKQLESLVKTVDNNIDFFGQDLSNRIAEHFPSLTPHDSITLAETYADLPIFGAF